MGRILVERLRRRIFVLVVLRTKTAIVRDPIGVFFYVQCRNVKDLLMTDFKPFLETFSVCLVAWYGLGDWVD